MPHPHILQKSLVDITATAKASIENVYAGAKPADADDVCIRYHTARGILILWSDIAFDMGATPLINVAANGELESLLTELDNAARSRIGMPLVGQ
ncbi:hypothetical protein LPN04_31125 [Rugamonas sp. A1-17]|nr:hypothetical protein [Rugamonas sp. A1-17]